MKYRVTIEIDDPERAMGDSPPPTDLAAWSKYLDIPFEPDFRIVSVEVTP